MLDDYESADTVRIPPERKGAPRTTTTTTTMPGDIVAWVARMALAYAGPRPYVGERLQGHSVALCYTRPTDTETTILEY